MFGARSGVRDGLEAMMKPRIAVILTAQTAQFVRNTNKLIQGCSLRLFSMMPVIKVIIKSLAFYT